MGEIKLCECGCGLPAAIPKVSDSGRGWLRGRPLKFKHGHNRKKKIEYTVDNDTGCWNWILAIRRNGYGSSNGRSAHRVYYERYKGAPPIGYHIDHLCKNRRCVNPDHLEAVTPKINKWRSAKLTEEQAATIRRLISNGVPRVELAAHYNMSITAIRSVAIGNTWIDARLPGLNL